MAKYCKSCGRNQDEHPQVVVGIRSTRYCDLMLVEDVVDSDGNVTTIESEKSPYERTRKNNIRFVHTSRLVAR